MRLRFLALCKIFAIEGHFCDTAAGHTKTLRVANIPMHNPQGVKRKFFYAVTLRPCDLAVVFGVVPLFLHDVGIAIDDDVAAIRVERTIRR